MPSLKTLLNKFRTNKRINEKRFSKELNGDNRRQWLDNYSENNQRSFFFFFSMKQQR